MNENRILKRVIYSALFQATQSTNIYSELYNTKKYKLLTLPLRDCPSSWGNKIYVQLMWAFQVAQWCRILLPMQETWVPSLGWEDPLKKEMAILSSIIAWEIPWTEEPSGLQSMEISRVRHDLATKQQ